jgi:predicted O-methyltransferase YrrM
VRLRRLETPQWRQRLLAGVRARASWAAKAARWRIVGYEPGWGPLNSQHERTRVVAELIRLFQPSEIVETGTFHGASAAYFAGFGVPVFTVEVHAENVIFSRRRLRKIPQLTLIWGDSLAALELLVDKSLVSRPLAYLDAHWHGRLPVAEEFRILTAGTREGVVVVDDALVPDDPAYGFDTYDGRPVSLALVELPDDAAAAFPAVPGELETGARRGTVYLGYGPGGRSAIETLVARGDLRPAPPTVA